MKMFASLVAVTALAGSAAAQFGGINSLHVEERIFNDFPSSQLSITGNYQDGIRFREDFPQFTPGNFANKHWGTFATDGTDYLFQDESSFQICFDITMNAVDGRPRKEGGLFLRNPHRDGWTAEGALLVASDGEVAVFGAGLPFFTFGNNAYTLGTTARVIFNYYGTEVGTPAIEVIFNGVSSGVLKFGDLGNFNGFNDGTRISLNAQNQRNPLIDDFSDIYYQNIKVIPAPGAIALAGLIAASGLRRRR